MNTSAYIKRIIECVDLMVKIGVVSSVEELEMEYGLPAIKEEVLSNESEESVNRIIEALSDKGTIYKTYIQTGDSNQIIDVNNRQEGHNLFGNGNKTKESALEEDCCVKLEKALIEIRYLKESLKERDKELEQKNLLISELINKIK